MYILVERALYHVESALYISNCKYNSSSSAVAAPCAAAPFTSAAADAFIPPAQEGEVEDPVSTTFLCDCTSPPPPWQATTNG